MITHFERGDWDLSPAAFARVQMAIVDILAQRKVAVETAPLSSLMARPVPLKDLLSPKGPATDKIAALREERAQLVGEALEGDLNLAVEWAGILRKMLSGKFNRAALKDLLENLDPAVPLPDRLDMQSDALRLVEDQIKIAREVIAEVTQGEAKQGLKEKARSKEKVKVNG
jgi:hypothetical protein